MMVSVAGASPMTSDKEGTTWAWAIWRASESVTSTTLTGAFATMVPSARLIDDELGPDEPSEAQDVSVIRSKHPMQRSKTVRSPPEGVKGNNFDPESVFDDNHGAGFDCPAMNTLRFCGLPIGYIPATGHSHC